jgi:hypothetical protein
LSGDNSARQTNTNAGSHASLSTLTAIIVILSVVLVL